MNRLIRTAGLALAVTLAPTAALAPLAANAQSASHSARHQAMPTEREVAANFDRWSAALASGNPQTVTALFAPGAILAPTVSNEVRTTPARIQAYFVDFLKLSPRPTINQRSIVLVDSNTAIDAGIWTFDLTRDRKPEWVTARYTFVWEKTRAGWQIQMLHSSLMPEGQTTRPDPLTAAR